MGVPDSTLVANTQQILKCRDDREPVILVPAKESTPDVPRFQLREGCSATTWTRADEPVGTDKLRTQIEPWLTALFQSEHLALLVGSGLTHAIHRMAAGSPLPGMAAAKFTAFSAEIASAAKQSAERAGRKVGNIEDQIRVANELLRGLEVQTVNDQAESELRKAAELLQKDLELVLNGFAKSILQGEAGLVSAAREKREEAFTYLVSFLMSFASRTGTRERLQLFTTNYDRYLEAGADAAGLHLIDRFVGTLAPIFRSSRLDVDLHYNPPGIRGEPRYLEGVARFTKLHGSLDWVDSERTIRRLGVPFGAADLSPHFSAPGLAGTPLSQLMIYPNASKDRETAAYPYVELFRDFAAAVCRPNSTLFSFGYSFGDEHINRVIEDMLTIPSAHLVVISYDDPLGRIMGTYEKLGRHPQITLMLGDHLGALRAVVDNYLPKAAIDRTTFRMAELLNARWRAGQSKDKGNNAGSLPDGEPNP